MLVMNRFSAVRCWVRLVDVRDHFWVVMTRGMMSNGYVWLMLLFLEYIENVIFMVWIIVLVVCCCSISVGFSLVRWVMMCLVFGWGCWLLSISSF